MLLTCTKMVNPEYADSVLCLQIAVNPHNKIWDLKEYHLLINVKRRLCVVTAATPTDADYDWPY